MSPAGTAPRCRLTFRPHAAGQDATEAFYGLHKQEVLDRPQYKRLVIGTIQDEESLIASPGPGDISLVPYAEPTWLTPGYYSPYFKEVWEWDHASEGLCSPYIPLQTHRKYQKAIRKFMDNVITPDAAFNGPRGKGPSAEVNEKIAYVHTTFPHTPHLLMGLLYSELNLFAMALGPGKHLKGLKLMNGLVTPEEVCLAPFYCTMSGGLIRKCLV